MIAAGSRSKAFSVPFFDGDAYVVDYDDYHWGLNAMRKIISSPTHPGNIIKEDYLLPLSITIQRLAATITFKIGCMV